MIFEELKKLRFGDSVRWHELDEEFTGIVLEVVLHPTAYVTLSTRCGVLKEPAEKLEFVSAAQAGRILGRLG